MEKSKTSSIRMSLKKRLRVARFNSMEFIALGMLSITALVCGSGGIYLASIHNAIQEGALASGIVAMGVGLAVYLWKKSGHTDPSMPEII